MPRPAWRKNARSRGAETDTFRPRPAKPPPASRCLRLAARVLPPALRCLPPVRRSGRFPSAKRLFRTTAATRANAPAMSVPDAPWRPVAQGNRRSRPSRPCRRAGVPRCSSPFSKPSPANRDGRAWRKRSLNHPVSPRANRPNSGHGKVLRHSRGSGCRPAATVRPAVWKPPPSPRLGSTRSTSGPPSPSGKVFAPSVARPVDAVSLFCLLFCNKIHLFSSISQETVFLS